MELPNIRLPIYNHTRFTLKEFLGLLTRKILNLERDLSSLITLITIVSLMLNKKLVLKRSKIDH